MLELPMDHVRELDPFDVYCVNIMTLLVRNNVDAELVSEVVDALRQIKFEHFGLLEKINLIEQKANIDLKTGLYKYNENYLENVLKVSSRALEGTTDQDATVAYVRMDIDNFSRLNNTYGHDLGDKVLHGLAQIIRQNTRPTDWHIRFGGEEFDLMLPMTETKGATRVMQKIFKKIHAFYVPHQREKVKITISAGISEYRIAARKLKSIDHRTMVKDYLRIQKQADDALYHGKDQFKVWDASLQRQYPRIRRHYALHNAR